MISFLLSVFNFIFAPIKDALIAGALIGVASTLVNEGIVLWR